MWLSAELTDLRWHWGGAYVITYAGRWYARRRDGGGSVSARTPDGLLNAIRADYRACAVPR